MSYAHIVNGAVEQVGEIPTSWHMADGSSVSGFNLLPALWAGEGWLPVNETRHPFDPATQQEGGPVFTITATTVTADFPIGPRPAADINGDTLRARATLGLAANATFMALAAPTNAQVLAQVKVLTQENTALIRLAMGLLDSTAGT